MAYTTHTIHEFSLTGTSPVAFTMSVGGGVIYAGVGWARPGESAVKVRPNEIFAQYLGQTLPDMRDGITTPADIVRTFTIVSGITKTYEYAYGDLGSLTVVHHEPITGRLETGQFFIGTLFDDTTVIVTSGGNVLPAMIGNHVIDTAGLTGGVRMEVGTDVVAWKLVPKCHRYILYYVNAHGAWDSLVCEGGYRVTDSYARSETGVWPKANVGEDVAQTSEVFLNEVTRRYTLNTGWLTDAEAARMHHLLGSCQVWLCDTEDGNAMFPVKITNVDCPYKTFRNEGATMVNYEIKADLQALITRR